MKDHQLLSRSQTEIVKMYDKCLELSYEGLNEDTEDAVTAYVRPTTVTCGSVR
eukprot:SAG11_NODE_13852_length_636_cov_1.085661_1_plen_53_part_00